MHRVLSIVEILRTVFDFLDEPCNARNGGRNVLHTPNDCKEPEALERVFIPSRSVQSLIARKYGMDGSLWARMTLADLRIFFFMARIARK